MRKFAVLLVAIILVVALWVGGWMWGAGEIRNQVALLAQNDGETNPKITCATLNVGGFPFRFDVECVDGTLTQLDTTVTLSGLRASVLVYNPTHLLLSARAPLSIKDDYSGAQSRIDFKAFTASARLTSRDFLEGFTGVGWRIANVAADATGVTWNDTVVGDLLRMSADEINVQLSDLPEGRDRDAHTAMLGLRAAVSNFAFPELQFAAAQSSLEATLDQLPDDLNALVDPSFALRTWQGRGGKLTLVKWQGSQPSPDESFEITGVAGLDSAGLANGSITYITKGVLYRLLTGYGVNPLAAGGAVGGPTADGRSTNTLVVNKGHVSLGGVVDLGDILPAF